MPHEEEQNETKDNVVAHDPNFSFHEYTLLQLENCNKESSPCLASFGCNANVLTMKCKRRIVEKCVKTKKCIALASAWCNMSSIYHTVGTMCIRADHFF